MTLLATTLTVAIPIKIWNSARIEHKLQEQEALLLEARIEALTSQINPHFLFNTLTSISSLIRTRPDTARMLINRLSGLLRRRLRAHDHFVSLRDELTAVDEYLDIECVRFGPSLRVDKDLDPATLDHVVPSMILQPLVENSIKHGLADKLGERLITLRSQRQGAVTVLEVIDNGIGIDENGPLALAAWRDRARERLRAAPRHLRHAGPPGHHEHSRAGHAGAARDPGPPAAGTADRVT